MVKAFLFIYLAHGTRSTYIYGAYVRILEAIEVVEEVSKVYLLKDGDGVLPNNLKHKPATINNVLSPIEKTGPSKRKSSRRRKGYLSYNFTL
jgi:hypothetical protein